MTTLTAAEKAKTRAYLRSIGIHFTDLTPREFANYARKHVCV